MDTNDGGRGDAPVVTWDPRRESTLAECETKVRRYCLSALRNEADADDAAQDTFIRFLRCPAQIENAEAWLIHAAQCACRDILRRRVKHRAAELSDALPADGDDPLEAVIRMHSVAQLLTLLSDADRFLLESLYLRGLSVEHVAALLKVSVGNVWIMTLRAKRRAADTFRSAGIVIGGISVIPALRWIRDRLAAAQQRVQRLVGGRPADQAVSLVGSVTQLVLVPTMMLALSIGAGGEQIQPGYGGRSPAASTGWHAPSPSTAATGAPRLAGAGAAVRSGGVISAGGDAPVPSTGPPSGPVGLADNVLFPNRNPQQQDVGFSSFTPSPHYSRDHTIFASGTVIAGCAGSCPTLFRTQDGGATWHHLLGGGFLGGTVLLPPDYPDDQTLFAVNWAGLEESGGPDQAFHVVAPAVHVAGVDPGSSLGAPRVLLGGVPLLWYLAPSSAVLPGPALPAGVTNINDVVFTGPGTFLLTGTVADPAFPAGGDSVVLRCQLSCSTVATVPGGAELWLVHDQGLGSDGTVAAYATDRVLISHDQGSRFAESPFRQGVLVFLALAPRAGAWPALVASWASPSLSLLFATSTDDGVTYSRPLNDHSAASLTVSELLALPDGRWLAAVDTADTRGDLGVRCSHDDGVSWSYSC